MHQSGSARRGSGRLPHGFTAGVLTKAPLPGMGHPSGAEAEKREFSSRPRPGTPVSSIGPMTLVNKSGDPQPRTVRLPALAVLLTLILASLAPAVQADCLESPYPDVRSLEALGVQDPKKALEAIRTELAAAQQSAAADKRHLAALY